MNESKIVERLKFEAKKNLKKIVLPESQDLRILNAASKVAIEGIASVILVGNENEVLNKMKENGIVIPDSNFSIIEPKSYSKTESYANYLYELRKEKGLSLEEAKNLVLDNVYFGTMMVKRWRC